MFIRKIVLDNYRSYSHLEIEINSFKNYIYGVNGTGKTSILEAIYFLSVGRSFLKTEQGSLIKFDSKYAKASILLEDKKEKHILTTSLTKDGKDFYLDDNKLKNASELLSYLSAFYFNPESVFLFKEEPALRRKLFDIVLCQIDKKYLYSLSRYKKILKERNLALSKGYDQDVIDVLRDELVNLSYYLVYQRRKVVSFINKEISRIYSQIFGSEREVKLLYKTTSPLDDDKEEFINSAKKIFDLNKSRENISKMTLIGPHRDNFILNLDNKDISFYSSQGENRIGALALKLTLHKYESLILNKVPIFLLDDILSDLDDDKKRNLLNYLDDKMQVFITGVNKIDLPTYDLFEIQDHQIRRI